MRKRNLYLMENIEESKRLDIKTEPAAVRSQAKWFGIKQGARVLDVGCGSGKATSVLFKMIQPGGEIVGIDYSPDRIDYARKKFGKSGIDFRVADFMKPLDIGEFDFIWMRFVLEYFKKEAFHVVKNLARVLRPGGCICLLDLDYNCMSHYKMPAEMEKILFQLISKMENEYNFDPFAGRKLYSYLYDLKFRDIKIDIVPHHLIYGELDYKDDFNWMKKLEVAAGKSKDLFKKYHGGYEKFFKDFNKFFSDRRRFTYTPLIMCKGLKS